jgi:hypothetical protein
MYIYTSYTYITTESRVYVAIHKHLFNVVARIHTHVHIHIIYIHNYRIQRVYSHPQALAQCRGWLQNNLMGAEIIAESSTAKAAQVCICICTHISVYVCVLCFFVCAAVLQEVSDMYVCMCVYVCMYVCVYVSDMYVWVVKCMYVYRAQPMMPKYVCMKDLWMCKISIYGCVCIWKLKSKSCTGMYAYARVYV